MKGKRFKPVLLLPVLLLLILLVAAAATHRPNPGQKEDGQTGVKTYPHTYAVRPQITSPLTTENGIEMILSGTLENRFTWFPVTVSDRSGRWKQLAVNAADFPTLARSGLHAAIELDICKTITGRSIVEITELGRPGRLSEGGFLHEEEDIIAVIRGDNRLVKRMGLTHPQLARTLFHVINLIEVQLSHKHQLKRKSHTYHYHPFIYHGKKVSLLFEGTKGGQQSIFADEITGAMYVKIQRVWQAEEKEFIRKKYDHLTDAQLEELIKKLSIINTGEMQPYYIQRYGFYEGHTFWRADPIAITFIFGLRSIMDLEALFPARLYSVLTEPYSGTSD